MFADLVHLAKMRTMSLLCACLLCVSWLCIGTVWGQTQADSPPQRSSTRPKVIVEERPSRDTAKAKGELTFDDIKFDIEKDGEFKRSMLTKDIEELNKRTVRIRGYMLPASVFKQSGIEEFVLVRDNMECCFGPGAALYDCIMVRMEPGKTAEFSTRPIAVRGTFEIKEFLYPDSDRHYAIYQMTASEAK